MTFRIQRDIPMPLVTSGVEYGHLRQLAMQRVKDLGAPPVCCSAAKLFSFELCRRMRRAQLPRRACARGGHTTRASQNQSKSSGVDSEGLLCEWGVGNVFVVRPPLIPQPVLFASSAVLTFGMQLRGSKAGHPHWIVEVSICARVFPLQLAS